MYYGRDYRKLYHAAKILPELLNQMTNSTTDDAILDADGANHGADNMEGSFVIYPYQEYKSREMQII